MTPRSLSKILDGQGINHSIKYDTLIVYGDLVLKDIEHPISIHHPNLWVRGDVLIDNCPGITSLPSETLEANNIAITNCASIQAWPTKIYADTVNVYSCSGYKSLFDSEIYADDLISDCPGHSQDIGNVLAFRIKHDGDGKFDAVVYDNQGKIIWNLDYIRSVALHEMGFLKDIRCPREIGSYLREISLISDSSKVFAEEVALQYWKSFTDSKNQLSEMSLT